MIKVFVAEDEPFILRTIKSMIEDAHADFTVIGEAFNGEQAFDGIVRLQPDVVFTDIRMPLMDGLTLVEKLNGLQQDIIPVILSGFQDFEYARRAVRLGVWDYLLKPLDNEILTSVLKDIYSRISNKKKADQHRIFKNILDHPMTLSTQEIEGYRGFFNISTFYYMLVNSGSYCTMPCSWITPAKDFWLRYDLEEITGQILPSEGDYWVINTMFENQKLLVVGTDSSYDSVKQIFGQIHAVLESHDFPITSVLCSGVQSLESIGFHVPAAQITLTKQIRFGKSRRIIEGEDDSSIVPPSTKLSEINIDKHLNLLIQYGQASKFNVEIRRILASCEENEISQIRLERLIHHIMNLFYNEMSGLKQIKMADADLEISELISNSATYQDLSDGLCFIFDELFLYKKASVFSKDSTQTALMDNVENYIKNNYTKQITLQDLSNVFGLVPSYLSKKYKNIKGVSPIGYLINVRIEKAKDLLMMEPPLMMNEIADALGFSDPFYFSKVFKSVTGKSPSQFRST